MYDLSILYNLFTFWIREIFFKAQRGATQVHKLYNRKHPTVGIKKYNGESVTYQKKKNSESDFY